MIIARQFIAWNASGRDPSRRERSEGFVLGASVNVRPRKTTSLAVQKNASEMPGLIIPSPTGRILMGNFPGNKLPGLRRARSSRCYRSVPPGQLSQKIPKSGHIQPIKSRPESKGLIG